MQKRRRKYKIPLDDPEGFDVRMFARSIRSHFFDKETMEYFSSRLEEYSVFSDGEYGAFFITSEQLTSETKHHIIGSVVNPVDGLVQHLTGIPTHRSMEGMDDDNPRQWKIRYASYRNRSVSSYGSLLFSCLSAAEGEARRLAMAMTGCHSCVN